MKKIAILTLLVMVVLAVVSFLERTRPDALPKLKSFSAKPALADWVFGDKPRVAKGKMDFGSQVVQLTEDESIVIYFLKGKSGKKLVAESAVKLSDNSNKEYAFKDVVPLAQFDNVEIGALIFEPRDEDVRELDISLNQPEFDKPIKAKVAKLIGKTARDGDADTIFSLFNDGYQEVSDYRISFNGWDFVESDRLSETGGQPPLSLEELVQKRATEAANEDSSAPQPTPFAVSPMLDTIAENLADGQKVRTKMTLRVENRKTNQTSLLFIVILENGQVRATQINK